ncbi:MAG: hypothetical protein LBL30_01195 [Holosporales bacterium]|jgi:hypothetical protein|nr:hypothetical protein [Holosporales bacterium]
MARENCGPQAHIQARSLDMFLHQAKPLNLESVTPIDAYLSYSYLDKISDFRPSDSFYLDKLQFAELII